MYNVFIICSFSGSLNTTLCMKEEDIIKYVFSVYCLLSPQNRY